jgi:hypothetical protein
MARVVILGVVLFLAARPGTAEEPKKAGEKPDPRTLWVYEGGWFARAKDGSWQELNEAIFRAQGKPHKFGEAKRTKLYIDLHDEARRVYVRLYDRHAEVLTRKGDWEKLTTGRWKAPD